MFPLLSPVIDKGEACLYLSAVACWVLFSLLIFLAPTRYLFEVELKTHRYLEMKLFERVPDLLGYLVLNEDGAILSSDGDLENAEATANVFTTIVGLTDKLGSDDERYKKLSITFSDCTYMVCLSNRKFFIVKRRYQPPPRPITADEESPASGDF